ncbi:hypothetical protein LCGC14_1509530 [marine sediment metagenome]|uniref:Uncharacterized protein n=1 Tax=marine sediment metagenome TaxID=412755 RepID=A0A0F9M302_9ZZZZ
MRDITKAILGMNWIRPHEEDFDKMLMVVLQDFGYVHLDDEAEGWVVEEKIFPRHYWTRSATIREHLDGKAVRKTP